jgi:GAF domain
MERYSILDPGTPSFPPEEVVSQSVATPPIPARSTAGSISAAIAAANAALDLNRNDTSHNMLSALRFPGDDGGQSLAEMANRDLDAALQLLADRAQFITGASGAAIALRRSGRKDMLCRASTGSNAPGLGALLSAEAGLSGESVRTRTPLRCDDTERDPRVNRDGCRELGIASVIIMPIESDDQVLGVFELFSGQINAFGERDLSALQRLAGMVETAVRVTQAPESSWLESLGVGVEESGSEAAALQEKQHEVVTHEVFVDTDEDLTLEDLAEQASRNLGPVVAEPHAAASPLGTTLTATTLAAAPAPASAPVEAAVPATPKRPLFWSAAAAVNTGHAAGEGDQSHIPAVLRNLHKCQACNFPVSEGRKLCVECEEKKWRGQLRYPAPVAAAAELAKSTVTAPKPTAAVAGSIHGSALATPAVPAKPVNAAPAPKVDLPAAAKAQGIIPQAQTFPKLPATAFLAQAPASAPVPSPPSAPAAAPISAAATAVASPNPLSTNEIEISPAAINEIHVTDIPPSSIHVGSSDEAAAPPILSGGIGSEQSWLSRNKYILGTLAAVGAAIAAVFLLR